jgi:hypothetical protein
MPVLKIKQKIKKKNKERKKERKENIRTSSKYQTLARPD